MNRWLKLSPGMSVILCICWTSISVLGQCLLWMNPLWKWYLLAADTVLELFRGSSTYLRPDIYLTGFQAPVRIFAFYCFSVIVSRGQRCVGKNMLIYALQSCMFKRVLRLWNTHCRSLLTHHVQKQQLKKGLNLLSKMLGTIDSSLIPTLGILTVQPQRSFHHLQSRTSH